MQKPGPTAQEEVTFEIVSAESAKLSLVEIACGNRRVYAAPQRSKTLFGGKQLSLKGVELDHLSSALLC